MFYHFLFLKKQSFHIRLYLTKIKSYYNNYITVKSELNFSFIILKKTKKSTFPKHANIELLTQERVTRIIK